MRPIYDEELQKIYTRCGGLFSTQQRIERAMVLASMPGLDQTAAAICVGWSQSWTCRRLDPAKYQRHLEYNARWKREKRASMKTSTTDTIIVALIPAFIQALNESALTAALTRIADALEAKKNNE